MARSRSKAIQRRCRSAAAPGRSFRGRYPGYATHLNPSTSMTRTSSPSSSAAPLSAARAGKIVAAVCHGPAALVHVDVDGAPLVRGKRVAGFTNEEERLAKLDAVVPFLLEDRLRALGAEFQRGPTWQPFAVRDGNLVTGQNPASSALVARKVLEAVRE